MIVNLPVYYAALALYTLCALTVTEPQRKQSCHHCHRRQSNQEEQEGPRPTMVIGYIFDLAIHSVQASAHKPDDKKARTEGACTMLNDMKNLMQEVVRKHDTNARDLEEDVEQIDQLA